MSIGQFYGDFRQTSDDEVITLLTRAAVRFGTSATAPLETTRASSSRS
jgi:predicted phosphoribosyltransferase